MFSTFKGCLKWKLDEKREYKVRNILDKRPETRLALHAGKRNGIKNGGGAYNAFCKCNKALYSRCVKAI